MSLLQNPGPPRTARHPRARHVEPLLGGDPRRRSDGYDLADTSRSPAVVLGWRDTLSEAELLLARWGRSGPPEDGRYIVVRHPGASGADPVTYEVIDTATGHAVDIGDDAGSSGWVALAIAGGLNRGQPPTTDEAEPDGADTLPMTDLDLLPSLADAAAARDPAWTLDRRLMLQADLLKQTGTIGPDVRELLAALVRDHAETARLTGARTVAELFAPGD